MKQYLHWFVANLRDENYTEEEKEVIRRNRSHEYCMVCGWHISHPIHLTQSKKEELTIEEIEMIESALHLWLSENYGVEEDELMAQANLLGEKLERMKEIIQEHGDADT
jgi:hypothetical protein